VANGNLPHLSANQAKIIAEQERCFDLREEGKSIREIARITGLGRQTVVNRLDDEWIRRIGPRSDRRRETQLARIEEAYVRLLAEKDAIEVGENVDAIVRLTNSQVTLFGQEAKLCGLYAPEKLQVSGNVEVPIPEHLRAAIAEAEEAAERQAAAREAAIRARNGDH
jgi:DNA-binding Lrp family transcriptional regulator